MSRRARARGNVPCPPCSLKGPFSPSFSTPSSQQKALLLPAADRERSERFSSTHLPSQPALSRLCWCCQGSCPISLAPLFGRLLCAVPWGGAEPGAGSQPGNSLGPLSCPAGCLGREGMQSLGQQGGCSRKSGLPSWVCSMWGCLSGLPKHFPNTLITVIYMAKSVGARAWERH